MHQGNNYVTHQHDNLCDYILIQKAYLQKPVTFCKFTLQNPENRVEAFIKKKKLVCLQFWGELLQKLTTASKKFFFCNYAITVSAEFDGTR